jgi:hypothetical protein
MFKLTGIDRGDDNFVGDNLAEGQRPVAASRNFTSR